MGACRGCPWSFCSFLSRACGAAFGCLPGDPRLGPGVTCFSGFAGWVPGLTASAPLLRGRSGAASPGDFSDGLGALPALTGTWESLLLAAGGRCGAATEDCALGIFVADAFAAFAGTCEGLLTAAGARTVGGAEPGFGGSRFGGLLVALCCCCFGAAALPRACCFCSSLPPPKLDCAAARVPLIPLSSCCRPSRSSAASVSSAIARFCCVKRRIELVFLEDRGLPVNP